MFIDPGTYYLNSTKGLNYATLTAGIAIKAFKGTATFIIGKANKGQWYFVFGPAGTKSTTDLSGLDVDGVIFDFSQVRRKACSMKFPRAAVAAFAGHDIRVHDCQFIAWEGRQCIYIGGARNLVEDAWVYNNDWTAVGGPLIEAGDDPHIYDSSMVYISAHRITGYGNHAVATIQGPKEPSTAVAAWEIHGTSVDWYGNHCENFQCGGNLVGIDKTPQGPVRPSYKWHHNTAINCASMINLFPILVAQNAMTDVSICNNSATISIDQWPLSAPLSSPHHALGLVSGNGIVEGLRFEDNDIVWLPHKTPASIDDVAISWVHSQQPSGSDSHISIRRNRFINCPSAGVEIVNFYGLVDWDVNENTFVNVGNARLGANYQTTLLIQDFGFRASAPGIVDFRFNGNKVIDDQPKHTLSSPVVLAAGTSRKSNKVKVTLKCKVISDPKACYLDEGSFVVASDGSIPPGAYVTTLDPRKKILTISHPATATGTPNITVTRRNAPVTNMEILDLNTRVKDGTAVPPFVAQTGQQIYVRSAVPAFKAPSGNAVAGSALTDRTTGITWLQTARPAGSTWVNAASALSAIAPMSP